MPTVVDLPPGFSDAFLCRFERRRVLFTLHGEPKPRMLLGPRLWSGSMRALRGLHGEVPQRLTDSCRVMGSAVDEGSRRSGLAGIGGRSYRSPKQQNTSYALLHFRSHWLIGPPLAHLGIQL